MNERGPISSEKGEAVSGEIHSDADLEKPSTPAERVQEIHQVVQEKQALRDGLRKVGKEKSERLQARISDSKGELATLRRLRDGGNLSQESFDQSEDKIFEEIDQLSRDARGYWDQARETDEEIDALVQELEDIAKRMNLN